MRYLNPLFCLYSLSVKVLSRIYIPRAFRYFVYKAFGNLLLGMNKNDLKECSLDLYGFRNISEFFSRPLQPIFRPIGSNKIISPCDGTVLEEGLITNGTIIRVKGMNYNVAELMGEDASCLKFKNGHYVNIYLSPRNYHRFHLPCDGKITYIQHVPGCCLPVNRLGRKVKKLYSLNERVIVEISNKEFNVCLAIVGAAAVRGIKIFRVTGDTVHKGEPLGMFELGSSIVLLTDTNIGSIGTKKDVKACSNI